MDNSFGKILNKTVIKQGTKEKNNLSSCNAAIKSMVAIAKADKQCNHYFSSQFSFNNRGTLTSIIFGNHHNKLIKGVNI